MSSKTILNLIKQNDSIYSSLVARNIQFERVEILSDASDEEKIKLLTEENFKLKEVVKANKPAQPAQPAQQSKQTQSNKTEKKSKSEEKEDEEEDEKFENEIKKFDTITNMEDIKRAFFSVENNDYTKFDEGIKEHPFKLYNVKYKFNSYNDGYQVYMAKNLLGGFKKQFDDYRKYFMICFRCWKLENKLEYKYDGLWIVNTNEPLVNIIGSLTEDFDFEEITDKETFIQNFKSIKANETDDEPIQLIDNYSCIGETYIH